MEERANAYQLMLWDTLRTQKIAVPDFANLRIEVLGHTELAWAAWRSPTHARRNSGLTPRRM